MATPDNVLSEANILIVDDEEINLLLLERILHKAGYTRLTSTSDPREALPLFERLRPDLVLLDLHMPHLDGIAITAKLRSSVAKTEYLPILILTADLSPEAEQRALASGAKDFINKPFKPAQIYLRIRNLLETRFLHLELQRQNQSLEEKVAERTVELAAARLDILGRLALAAEYRDYSTGRHTQRVGYLSAQLARRLGLSRHEVELLRHAAPLHDVGKIGIPDSILLKPDRLTPQETRVMKGHVEIGAKLLAHGHSEVIQMAEVIALTHHEHWDGSGYPRGLKGEEIPLSGQIVAVADVFDALVNRRPYKAAWPVERAVAEIKRQSGRWFNPRVVTAFLQVLADEPALLETGHDALSPAGFSPQAS